MNVRNWIIAGAIAGAAAACGGSTAPADGPTNDGGGTGNDGSDGDGDGSSGDTDGGGGPGSDGGGGGPGDGGGGPTDGGGALDGAGNGDAGASPACPATAPKAGGACPINNAVCEYGGDAKPDCNTMTICTLGKWVDAPRGACPPAGGTCPDSYGTAQKVKACTPEFLDCAYAEGQCNCARSITRADPTWICTATSPNCAAPRPRLGTACSAAGRSCDYGACTGGVAETCKDGFWQREVRPCPG